MILVYRIRPQDVLINFKRTVKLLQQNLYKKLKGLAGALEFAIIVMEKVILFGKEGILYEKRDV